MIINSVTKIKKITPYKMYHQENLKNTKAIINMEEKTNTVIEIMKTMMIDTTEKTEMTTEKGKDIETEKIIEIIRIMMNRKMKLNIKILMRMNLIMIKI